MIWLRKEKCQRDLEVVVRKVTCVDSLNECCEKGSVDGFSQVFEKDLLLFGGAGPGFFGKAAAEGGVDFLTVSAEGRCDADVVGV